MDLPWLWILSIRPEYFFVEGAIEYYFLLEQESIIDNCLGSIWGYGGLEGFFFLKGLMYVGYAVSLDTKKCI